MEKIILALLDRIKVKDKELAQYYNLTQATISNYKNGKLGDNYKKIYNSLLIGYKLKKLRNLGEKDSK